MISTRPFHSPDTSVECCRRPGQGLSLPLPQFAQSDHHPEANESVHRRLSPSSEADSKCISGQARRRIAVACQRCRKRKIKCSGDPGNGQGCSNCRSAGAAPSLCTFLRVNSRECETYLATRGVPVGGRYSPYPLNQSMATRSSSLQVQPGNVATGGYVGVPGGYDCFNGLYGAGTGRSNYPACPANYDDDSYNGQSPAYMLPNNNEPVLNNNSIFGQPASPRNWDVFSSSTRAPNGLYPDPNPSSSGSLTNGSFSGNSMAFASSNNDVPSSFSSGPTIATSMTSLDRTLPNPTMGRSQQPAFLMPGGHLLEGSAMTNVTYRNSIPCVGSDGMSASSQSSDRVLSIGYGSTADSTAGSGESSTTSQDAPFVYISTSHSSPRVSIKANIVRPNGDKAEAGRKPDDSASDRRSRKLPQESTPSPESAMAEAYGYHGDVTIRRRSTRGSTSAGTLSNGQEYTRLRLPPTTAPELYRSSQHDAPEYQSHIAHRTSIASLSSSGRY